MKPFKPVHASEAPFSRTMHYLSNQGMKPSGLRMPSPSLSFFSEVPIHDYQVHFYKHKVMKSLLQSLILLCSDDDAV